MAKIEEAQEILRALGLPLPQQNEMSALTLLALANIRPGDSWCQATRKSHTVTKGIMVFVAKEYGKLYAPNTRETFRRQVLHQLCQADIVNYNPDNPDLPTNSPRAHYALTPQVLPVIQSFGTDQWNSILQSFSLSHRSLKMRYQGEHTEHSISVVLEGNKEIKLTPGIHNVIEAAIIQKFLPYFAPGAKILYLGDTANKELIFDPHTLDSLCVKITGHGKLPDVILFDAKRNRIFLMESVTTHGPMTPKRVIELGEIFSKCSAQVIYVSAFKDMATFRKYLKDIAWETEVWIVEIPEHLIHFNGDHYL